MKKDIPRIIMFATFFIIIIWLFQNRSENDDLEGEPGDFEALQDLREGNAELVKMTDDFWENL